MKIKKILIVDDEPDIVQLISYNLKKEGFHIATALDGEEALKKVRRVISISSFLTSCCPASTAWSFAVS